MGGGGRGDVRRARTLGGSLDRTRRVANLGAISRRFGVRIEMNGDRWCVVGGCEDGEEEEHEEGGSAEHLTGSKTRRG